MLLLNKVVVDHRIGAELLLVLESSLFPGEFCCRFNSVQAVLPETPQQWWCLAVTHKRAYLSIYRKVKKPPTLGQLINEEKKSEELCKECLWSERKKKKMMMMIKMFIFCLPLLRGFFGGNGGGQEKGIIEMVPEERLEIRLGEIMQLDF